MNTEIKSEKAEGKDYKNLIDLMAIYAESSARMDELEADLNQAWLDLVDARRADYSKLQLTLSKAEEAIKELSIVNPQWFAKVKTLRTPYGTVAFRRSTKLEVKNEEASIILLEQLGQDGLPFLKTEKTLVLEALEKLDDAELECLRIRRVESESCTIKAAKPDLGKAVAAAAKAHAKGGEA
jgi:hypothetical protein